MIRSAFIAALAFGLAGPATAEVSATVRAAFPDATYVERYTPAARATAAQAALHLMAPPQLGAPVSLTPDRTFADDMALNIWKPSFVLGTSDGGEAGINFWGQHTDGHVNVAFTPSTGQARLIDCRVLTDGAITYKIYSGTGTTPMVEQVVAVRDHHVLVQIPVARVDQPVLVEFWPSPTTAVVAVFGCDISTMG